MAQITIKNPAGADAGTVELDDAVFGIQPNVPVMHQVVTAQLAHRRSGTQSTKSRSDVRGGGAKPYRQKGTGNARQGSTNAPHYTGGGVAHAPKPRKYAQKTPKKMVRLALRSALSDRAADGKVLVVDSWAFETPKTKEAADAISALGLDGKVLVVLGRDDAAAARSFRNLPGVHLLLDTELNAYDVLCSDWIVFTEANLPAVEKAPTEVPEAEIQPIADLSADAVDATPADDVEVPEGAVKGNADSMLYHTVDSPYYGRTKAEQWFETEEAAQAAGFTRWDRNKTETES